MRFPAYNSKMYSQSIRYTQTYHFCRTLCRVFGGLFRVIDEGRDEGRVHCREKGRIICSCGGLICGTLGGTLCGIVLGRGPGRGIS